MLIVGFVLLSILVGYLQGSRINRELDIKLNYSFLIWIAFVIQASLPFLDYFFGGAIRPYGLLFHLVAYILVASFLLFNWDINGLPILTTGLICNLFAIVSSGGYMPISPALINDPSINFTTAIEMFKERPLWFLGDIFVLPRALGGTTFSIGDILIGVGLYISTKAVLFTKPKRFVFQINRYQPKHLCETNEKRYYDIA